MKKKVYCVVQTIRSSMDHPDSAERLRPFYSSKRKAEKEMTDLNKHRSDMRIAYHIESEEVI